MIGGGARKNRRKGRTGLVSGRGVSVGFLRQASRKRRTGNKLANIAKGAA